MKLLTLQKTILYAAAGLLLAGCSRSDDEKNKGSFADAAKMSAQVDEASDDILKIIEDQYSAQANGEGRMSPADIQLLLPDCATVTTVANGNTWTRTINFGTTSCELYNGNVVTGILIVSGMNDFESMQQTIEYSFENFYHNGRHIEGNKFATRIASNGSGNPQSTITLDLTITFVNGTVAERTGNRTWEWVAGVNTPFNPFDNEYLVSGSWQTAFPDQTLSTTVTGPLRVKLNCEHITEGTLHFTAGNNEAELNYGDGNCDAVAELSINGGAASTFYLNN